MVGELKLGLSISRLKAGWQRWPGAAGICGDTAGLGGAGGGREGR
jgi:hypothetical protein